MSFVKNKLKLARDAIGKRDFVAARNAADEVLEYEPENYNANVFLGLTLLELGDLVKSEQVYLKAIDLNTEQLLAWQGITKFYERIEAWGKYSSALQHLMSLYNKSGDAVKCSETWQKLVELRRTYGTRLELVDTLSLLLPDSPFYAILSTLPPPESTKPTSTSTYVTQAAIQDSLSVLEELVGLLEEYEETLLKKEGEKRRTRLGAPGPEQIKREIGREIWGVSRLPMLYNEILNHPRTSDELRRLTDSKLLRFKQQYLHTLPNSGEWASVKAVVGKELDELVNGVVILGLPDELAWMIFLEGQDVDKITEYDLSHIKEFMKLFPTSPISFLFKGYFTFMSVPISETGEQESGDVPKDDTFDAILNAYSLTPNSIIANRILADVYLNESDYENAIRTAESGLELLLRAENNTGKKLSRVQLGFKVILATSFVHLFPPTHHPHALLLINEVLTQSPDNVACLMGRAYIMQEAKKWNEAATLFVRVDALLPDDLNVGLRAREENAWCHCQLHDFETGLQSLQAAFNTLHELDGRESDCARCLWRLGKCHWDMDDSKREEAYRYFITSLKHNSTYAPAFTSLGIYYSEFASPPDHTRASKCFQKAFELDPREADAARRLAIGFAEDREWDLVEVIARRTIVGEGGLEAGFRSTNGRVVARYLPTNAWAWKAVGVVELNRQNHPAAIQAFQVALRAEPDDQLSWLRLGEAYSRASRHVAAVKALARAHELQPDDWMCSYLVGEVKQRMGHFQEAITAFETILQDRPAEVGVLVSLGQAYLELGRSELVEGFQSRAEQSFVSCIRVGLRTIEESPGFRNLAWKTVADAIFFLSGRSSFVNEAGVRNVLVEVVSLLPSESDHLAGIISLPLLQDDTHVNGVNTLEIAAAAYSYRISLSSSKTGTKNGSLWYDLGVSLLSWDIKSPIQNHDTTRNKSIACLTQAIQEDPGNDAFWIALGDAKFLASPKTAQHAYITALEIDSKNVTAWTNLGLLYLHHNDFELANEVFYRAQILDPDNAVAWIGQALVATVNGHDREADSLLEHAVSLSPNLPEADLGFAFRVFKKRHIIDHGTRPPRYTILPAFFILERYCERRPDDASALHLFGLICESLGHLEYGLNLISRAIAILESAYEDTEDPEVERHFTIANSNFARLRLSLRDYQGAVESFESVLGLLSEDNHPTTRILRAQAQFGSGLASFMQNDLDTALRLFEASLASAGDNLVIRGQVTVLLAQTMWVIHTDEFKESAKSQLLECITTDPENLAAINALAVMGIITQDDSLVDAALSEILSLAVERRRELDPLRDVDYILIQYHLAQEESQKALSVSQGKLFENPSHPNIRNELASLTLQRGENTSALALLSGLTPNTEVCSPLYESMRLRAIALCLDSNPNHARASLREAQRAIMLRPGDIRNWQTLAYVRSRSA